MHVADKTTYNFQVCAKSSRGRRRKTGLCVIRLSLLLIKRLICSIIKLFLLLPWKEKMKVAKYQSAQTSAWVEEANRKLKFASIVERQGANTWRYVRVLCNNDCGNVSEWRLNMKFWRMNNWRSRYSRTYLASLSISFFRRRGIINVHYLRPYFHTVPVIWTATISQVTTFNEYESAERRRSRWSRGGNYIPN